MKAELILNEYDAGPWLKENGLTQTEVVRSSRSVVTLNGTKYQGEIIKRGISASFVEMRDTSWYRLVAALRERPVKVRYIDDDIGPRTAYFLVSSPTASAKVVRGGITYFSGGSVTLEEV